MPLSSMKRYGARYGRSLKERYSIIEDEQKTLYECPDCGKFKLKRVSRGIWQCTKCNAKVAGKAYSVSKKIVVQEFENAPVVEKKHYSKKSKRDEDESGEE